MAILLLANAVRDYWFVSRFLATQQVRRQMSELTAQVEQQFRRGEATQQYPLASAIGKTLRGGESVSLRDFNGALLEHLGSGFVASPFTSEDERNAFSRREPLFRIVPTPLGESVIEVFTLHIPRRPPSQGRPPVPVPPVDGEPRGPQLLKLEVALPLKRADASVLQPIRRNLIINSTAALALLATVVLAGVGLRSYARGRRLEEQVEIAKQVQSKLLPDPLLNLPGIEMATMYKPSEEVGGDFYDVFANHDDGFAAVIGDVSGKGLPAALLMGVIHGAVRTAGWQGAQVAHEEESARLNRLLFERADGNRFASMFWCVYERPLQTLRYVNAGHCPPFLLSKRNGELTTHRLEDGGPVLGLLQDARYTSAVVNIASGDLLVMYSDGLVEATNPEGEDYGEDRVNALLRNLFEERPLAILESMMKSWESFSPISHVQDDLTLTILRF